MADERTSSECMLEAPNTMSDAMDARALFSAHAPFVASFLRRLGVSAADLDDAVQEVFLVAHRKGGYLPGPAHPRTWLGAIALRVAQASRRARSRRDRTVSIELECAAASTDDPAEQLATRRSLDRVQQALEGLSLEQRAAFVLFEIEGESCESIASALAVPVGTVYSRLHHARQRFMQIHEALLNAAQRAPRSLGSTR